MGILLPPIQPRLYSAPVFRQASREIRHGIESASCNPIRIRVSMHAYMCVCVCVCVCADARVYSRYTLDARDASAKDAGRAHTGTCRGYRKDVRRVQRSDFAGMAGEKAFSASMCVLANWPAREVKYFCFDFGGVFGLCIYIYRRVEWGALCLKGERGILLKWR